MVWQTLPFGNAARCRRRRRGGFYSHEQWVSNRWWFRNGWERVTQSKEEKKRQIKSFETEITWFGAGKIG